MNDTMRYILAGLLIFIIIILQPFYLEWLGYETAPDETREEALIPDESDPFKEKQAEPAIHNESTTPVADLTMQGPGHEITIVTPLYMATISSHSGGSIKNYILRGENSGKLKYMGGYDEDGNFSKDIPVSIILPDENHCRPCLAFFDNKTDEYSFFNQSFSLRNSSNYSDTLWLGPGETTTLHYYLSGNDGSVLIDKSLKISADEFVSLHQFKINDNDLEYSNNLEIMWHGGLRPTEEKTDEDVQYGSGIISQAKELEDVQTTNFDENILRSVYNGHTEWAAVRTKYFISALLVDSPGKYAALSEENVTFGSRSHTPAYNASIGYPYDVNKITAHLYLGPLDVDHLSATGSTLDETMNWGYSLIQPISKGVLWVLKFMHNALKLNYGLVLLLFAVLVRLITGPLTKKSFESSQNMQKIQPEIKALQAKYKADPQRLNKEMMGLYKKHGVNPLGGCLPILLQMPLLWALFIVFRTTIEFRGAPFVLWISDLSKPDIIFNLPFSIPIYGDGVAILPLIMGGTLLLTMRMSSATMDKSQKPIMYFMNGFFILLFNTFPSGLNLYYTTYNILSFFQQRSIRNKITAK